MFFFLNTKCTSSSSCFSRIIQYPRQGPDCHGDRGADGLQRRGGLGVCFAPPCADAHTRRCWYLYPLSRPLSSCQEILVVDGKITMIPAYIMTFLSQKRSTGERIPRIPRAKLVWCRRHVAEGSSGRGRRRGHHLTRRRVVRAARVLFRAASLGEAKQAASGPASEMATPTSTTVVRSKVTDSVSDSHRLGNLGG